MTEPKIIARRGAAVSVFSAGQIPHQTSSKGIAGAGGIERLQRIGRNREVFVQEHRGAILASFYDQRADPTRILRAADRSALRPAGASASLTISRSTTSMVFCNDGGVDPDSSCPAPPAPHWNLARRARASRVECFEKPAASSLKRLKAGLETRKNV